MNLSNPELETVLRCVDKVFDFSAERDRLRGLLATLEAENKVLAARVAELEARCKRLEEVGDMIVSEYMVVEPEKSAWKQAKETKP